MKTTIDIPDDLLREVMRLTKAKTKKEAVITALIEYRKIQIAKELIASAGTWDLLSNDEIERGDMIAIEEANSKKAS